jgi:hypothetical protein
MYKYIYTNTLVDSHTRVHYTGANGDGNILLRCTADQRTNADLWLTVSRF